jgi:hypothetical protein
MFDEDLKLIGQLRAELAGWQQRAQDALALAQRNAAHLGALTAECERDALAIAAQALRLGAADLRIAELEQLVEALRCGDLVGFSSGELAPDRTEAFREHLGRCADCQKGLETSMAIDATLTAASRPRSP